MKFSVWAFLLCWTTVSVGQNIKIETPDLPHYVPQSPLMLPGASYQPSIEQRNQSFIDEDIRQYQTQNARKKEELKSAYKELGIETEESKERPLNISYSYPVNRDTGVKHYERAFNEITGMLQGKKPMDLKRAVFLTEHAYDTTLNYQQFEKQISKLVDIISLEMKQKKISPSDNLGKIMTVFKFMADTIKVKSPVTEKTITTYPKLYDFDDFYGVKDYHKMFVSKLVKTGKGQCHSLPLLFLILCQEIKAKAYLSFSPEHCHVKFIDKNGGLQNIELTNQMFTSDQFILQSGYITSSAIKNRIYMDTLGADRVVNYTLNDLSNNYVKKYGYDDFVFRCSNKVLQFDKKSIHAYMHLANYYNVLGHNIELQYQKRLVPREFYFENDNSFRAIVSEAIAFGKLIDELGYAQMPAEMYSKWLSSLKNESLRQQHVERKNLLNTMMEN